MEYLSTFGQFLIIFEVNVGKYSMEHLGMFAYPKNT